MGFTKIINNRLNEIIYETTHESGLKIIAVPMEGYSTSYAIFGTKYGSIDNCFKGSDDESFHRVPDGIAHFLEHKLFENEDCDAFARYARTGASANAYTSFDRTCYLFSCTDNFEASLEILLDFVQSPYFTAETVKKEQGIIGQEIRMYDDSPDWRVYFNLLQALYPKHPVHIDIAGTFDSIAKIDDKILYQCYNTFYNLSNMVLAVAGNIDPKEVLKIADKMLKPQNRQKSEIKRCFPAENEFPGETVKEQKFPVPTPIFMLGFKEKTDKKQLSAKDIVATEVILEIIAGASSPLYRRLLDWGLINYGFSSEIFEGPLYCAEIFSSQSSDPIKVRDEIFAEIESLRKSGISEQRFEAARRLIYGRLIGERGTADNIANLAVECSFAGRGYFDSLECAASLTVEDVKNRFDMILDKNRAAISIVKA